MNSNWKEVDWALSPGMQMATALSALQSESSLRLNLWKVSEYPPRGRWALLLLKKRSFEILCTMESLKNKMQLLFLELQNLLFVLEVSKLLTQREICSLLIIWKIERLFPLWLTICWSTSTNKSMKSKETHMNNFSRNWSLNQQSLLPIGSLLVSFMVSLTQTTWVWLVLPLTMDHLASLTTSVRIMFLTPPISMKDTVTEASLK